MIRKNIIQLKDGTEIVFGIPDKDFEFREMFALRHLVYVSEKNYIPKENGDGSLLEKDRYDLDNKCIYFIATIDDKIVGTARVIRSEPLPSEKDYYQFQTPQKIAKIPPPQRAEIGRIISRPKQKTDKSIPRHLVMLGIFFSMTQYGMEHNILGGYGSIKSSALKKLEKMGIPFYRIKKYSITYNPKTSEDPLKNFFSDSDPVKLIYFLTESVYKYCYQVFHNKKLFKEINNTKYLFNDNRLNFLDMILFKVRLFFN